MYSLLPIIFQPEEALKSAEAAMNSGFDNFDQIRRDKNLENMRKLPSFQVSGVGKTCSHWRKAWFGVVGHSISKALGLKLSNFWARGVAAYQVTSDSQWAEIKDSSRGFLGVSPCAAPAKCTNNNS